jgi:hypothetical protein
MRTRTYFKPVPVRFVYSLGFVLMMSIGFSSCIKNTVCKGDVFVVWNSTNKPVVGATVHSHYAQKSDVQTTDASGRVHLELNLPAILTIDITGPANPSPGGTTTSGTLKFESGKTNSVTLGL